MKDSLINIGIDDGDRAKVVQALNAVLGDLFVLSLKTKNYHWHVTGPHFASLHKTFEQHYEFFDKWIDEVAERAVIVGGTANRTLGAMKKNARVEEDGSDETIEDIHMVDRLLRTEEEFIRNLRRDIDLCDHKLGDRGTADFLAELMVETEKLAWMLRATVADSNGGLSSAGKKARKGESAKSRIEAGSRS